MRGVRAVTRVLMVFDSIKLKLENAIDLCIVEMNQLTDQKRSIQNNLTDIDEAKQRAVRVLNNIDKLVS